MPQNTQDSGLQAALDEYARWGTGCDTRRPKGHTSWVGRQGDDGSWQEVSSHANERDADRDRHVRALTAALSATPAHAPGKAGDREGLDEWTRLRAAAVRVLGVWGAPDALKIAIDALETAVRATPLAPSPTGNEAPRGKVPAGWRLVPEEPTKEMLFKAATAIDDAVDTTTDSYETYVITTGSDYALPAWEAMLAAAPTPPVSTDPHSDPRHPAWKLGDEYLREKMGSSFGEVRDCPAFAGCEIQSAFVAGWRASSSSVSTEPDSRAGAERNGIYMASKTSHAPRWRQLRADGVPIISTWIDEAGKGETKCFEDLWSRCVDEAATARAIIVYREPGEVLKGAFVEAGAALSCGVPVYAVGCDEFSFVNHIGVTLCGTLEVALSLAALHPSPPTASGAAAPVGETFDSIRQWCEETFGPITPERTVERAGEEFDELRAEPDNVTEAADVVIVLSRYPGLWAEINRKMAINRKREWRLMGDGTGYHVKAATPTPAPHPVPAGQTTGEV